MLTSALLVAIAGAARAQDVDRIVNGGFDEDLAGWAVGAFGASTGAWNALDVGGSGTSGSARTEMVYEGGANAVSLSQCVAVAPGEPHSFGAWIRLQAGGGEGQSFVRVQWYESTDCSGPTFDTSDTNTAFPSDDTWVLVQLVDEVPSGGAARSARVFLNNLSQDLSAPRVAFFDDAFFVPEPGAASAGAVALAALAALRTRRA